MSNFKTVFTWVIKATVMIAAPGGLFLAGYEAWKWWKHHNQKPQPAEALENKTEAEEAKVPQENEEKVN